MLNAEWGDYKNYLEFRVKIFDQSEENVTCILFEAI